MTAMALFNRFGYCETIAPEIRQNELTRGKPAVSNCLQQLFVAAALEHDQVSDPLASTRAPAERRLRRRQWRHRDGRAALQEHRFTLGVDHAHAVDDGFYERIGAQPERPLDRNRRTQAARVLQAAVEG